MKYLSRAPHFWALGFMVLLSGCSTSESDVPPWMRGGRRLVRRAERSWSEPHPVLSLNGNRDDGDLGMPMNVESPTFNDPSRSTLDSLPTFETPGDPGATTAAFPPESSPIGSGLPGIDPPPGFGVPDNMGLPDNLLTPTEPVAADNGFPPDIQAIIDQMSREAGKANEQGVLWDAEELKTAHQVVFVLDPHCDNTWMDFTSKRVDAAVAAATFDQKLEVVTNHWWALGRFAGLDPIEPDTTLSLLRRALEHKPDLIYLITDRGIDLDTALAFCRDNSQSATLQVVLFAEGFLNDDRCLDFIAGQNRGKLLTVPPPKREGG